MAMKNGLVVVAGIASIIASIDAHGAVVNPPPRNAVDKNLLPWSGPVPPHPPSVESKTGWCPVPDKDGKVSGQNGQSCFWFSNGCSIGCDICDGSSRGPIPNGGPEWRRKFNTCNQTTVKATICDPAHRTVNTGVECGADDDWYYYSPWRAPGNAPVFDSCGMAGGHHPPDGGFGGIYVNTTHAKLGDSGSKVLPPAPSGTVWKAGEVYEVSWTIEANHGGGYQYRIAPASGPLNEMSFQKTPLKFVGQQKLRYGGPNGTIITFNGTYVSDGTMPAGSTWVRNPVPRNDVGQTGQGFAPPCDEKDGIVCHGMTDGSTAVPNLEIVDNVMIPADLPAGEYVVGWRWDCEESNQIWQSCSDVTVTVA
eukprot:m.84522 g.84522  ORF g.84522 m.84522 type:complete len:365 (-) comp25761_c0_seq1:150-1244(-)